MNLLMATNCDNYSEMAFYNELKTGLWPQNTLLLLELTTAEYTIIIACRLKKVTEVIEIGLVFWKTRLEKRKVYMLLN